MPEGLPPSGRMKTTTASPLCQNPACTMDALNTVADRHTCYRRIRWLQSARASTLGLTELDACARVAQEFQADCGRCKPGTAKNCAVPPPTVLFSDGCSKSTAVMRLLTELLQLHGDPVVAPVYEPQICLQNYFCRPTPGVTAGEALVKALHDEVEWAGLRCRSVLLKVHCKGASWQQYSPALLALGAARRSIALYRADLLDVLICEVRDCINRQAGFVTTRRASEVGAEYEVGVKVGAHTMVHTMGHLHPLHAGSRPRALNCSIARRQLPHAMQPMVWLNPKTLLTQLREKLHAASHACIRQSWPSATQLQRASSEVLLLSELHAEPTSAGFNASAAAWMQLLQGLGVRPQPALLRAHLVSMPRRPMAEAMPQPHAQSIANADEVRQVLLEAGGMFARLWRA